MPSPGTIPTRLPSEPPAPYLTALRLEYFTVGYNILEAAASIAFGVAAGSIALIGFGLDSIVESFSGMVLIWRLRRHEGLSPEEEKRIEERARRLVAFTFLLLGAYVLVESLEHLLASGVVQPSMAGILIALLSLIIMPLLAARKETLGLAIGSHALVADSRETMACAYLSAGLLAGLAANRLFGLWQADPLAGLLISLFLFREGYEGWGEPDEAVTTR